MPPQSKFDQGEIEIIWGEIELDDTERRSNGSEQASNRSQPRKIRGKSGSDGDELHPGRRDAIQPGRVVIGRGRATIQRDRVVSRHDRVAIFRGEMPANMTGLRSDGDELPFLGAKTLKI
jgi:hypothetical protein